jgi:hypothetical protein
MEFVGPLVWLLPSTLLVVGGLMHGASPKKLLATLKEHSVLPHGLAEVATVAVIVVQCGVGGFAIWSGLAASEATIRLSLAFVAAVYVIFASYTIALVVSRPGMPCGCFGETHPATPLTTGRPVLLAVLAVVGAGMPSKILPGGPYEWMVSLLAVAGLAVVLWRFPDALYDPMRVAAPRRTGVP